MRILYILHFRARSLRRACACAASPEPSLLAYTKYGCRPRFRSKLRYLGSAGYGSMGA